MAPNVASDTDTRVLMPVTRTVVHTALITSCLWNKVLYQSREKPPHTELMADWLKDNVDNIFDSQENMELAMYNGELLERKYKDSGNAFEKIGWQAYKTVKYVYRGAESVDDQATVDNYTELKALLSSADNIA